MQSDGQSGARKHPPSLRGPSATPGGHLISERRPFGIQLRYCQALRISLLMQAVQADSGARAANPSGACLLLLHSLHAQFPDRKGGCSVWALTTQLTRETWSDTPVTPRTHTQLSAHTTHHPRHVHVWSTPTELCMLHACRMRACGSRRGFESERHPCSCQSTLHREHFPR